MRVINAMNVNEALTLGIQLMKQEGQKLSSRVGDTLEISTPVATVYKRPWERVLISEVRDANPFFHLMEAMWILAGRQDVKFLTEFNSRMGDYSDDGRVFNAPYGYRLREHVGGYMADQLGSIIKILKQDPNSRQAIAQIWTPLDLEKDTKDKACNMSIAFRIRDEKLTITVYNRSNDMIWGAYGANMVQFSIIQEYVAAHLGIKVGTYTQVSNSFHVYTTGPGGELWDKLVENYGYYYNPYDTIEQMTLITRDDIYEFEHDLKQFFNIYDEHGLREIGETTYWKSHYFKHLIVPMVSIFITHKSRGPETAKGYLGAIRSEDWRRACNDWLTKRVK